jgi:hypothetical protein
VVVFTTEHYRGLDACVAFYGLDSNHQRAQAFYDGALALCNRVNLSPTKLWVNRSGHKGEYTSFRLADLDLKEQGFESLEGFTLAVCPEGATAVMLEADLECDWAAEGWGLLVARSLLVNLDDFPLRDWLRESVSTLRPEYGIGYYRRRRLGSGLYAIGMGLSYPGEPPEESVAEIRRRKAWGDHGMDEAVWRQGILRDVYPWHILTKPQLDRAIGSVPLRDWIQQDHSRGTLTELVEGWWLWELPSESAEPVRHALLEAGVLYQPPPEEPDE